MDPTPFWSRPEIVRAAAGALVSLATLFVALASLAGAWKLYLLYRARHLRQREERQLRAELPSDPDLVSPAKLRRAADQRVVSLEAEVAAVKAKVIGLERDAILIKAKVDGAGGRLEAVEEQLSTITQELGAHMARSEEASNWIKGSLLRLETWMMGGGPPPRRT